MVYELGTAAHAFVTLAHYASLRGRARTGYVPPGARERLQGSHVLGSAPGSSGAALPPRGPDDPANFSPATPPAATPLIAPRVVTPIAEASIPTEVDYLIVGSGAGGAVMAYRLACATADPSRVLVVERGPRFSPPSDFSDDEMEMLRRLYKEGGLQLTKRFDLMLLQGECVGGSTVVNNACCVEMPARIREAWGADYGLTLDGLDAEYARVAAEIDIGPMPDSGMNSAVAQTFIDAVGKYNTSAESPLIDVPLRTNHRNALGTGLDNLGDRHTRKRSMLETYLPWAEARGVAITSETTAVCLLPSQSGQRADGVLLRSSMGRLHAVRVRKAVIVAGGVVASSHFLMRSGLERNVGQHVTCNFALPAILQFASSLDAFDGLQITRGAIDRESRALFETYFNPPGAFSIAVPFYFDRPSGADDEVSTPGELRRAGGIRAQRSRPAHARLAQWAASDLAAW